MDVHGGETYGLQCTYLGDGSAVSAVDFIVEIQRGVETYVPY